MLEKLKRWLHRQGAATVFSFVIEANPVPASRPRVPKWGRPYYAGNYRDWRTEAEGLLKEMVPQHPTLGPLFVIAEHVVTRPASRTKPYPRGDVDNYAKATLDAVTQAQMWTDDDQVTLLVSAKRYAGENEEPHTHVTIFHAPPT